MRKGCRGRHRFVSDDPCRGCCQSHLHVLPQPGTTEVEPDHDDRQTRHQIPSHGPVALPTASGPATASPARRAGFPPICATATGRCSSHERRTQDEALLELVRIGFKGNRSGLSAASQTDFDFCAPPHRRRPHPEDVTLMVMTQSRRPDCAHRQAVKGAPRAIVHLYNATAPAWRRMVFGMNVTQVMQLITHHVVTSSSSPMRGPKRNGRCSIPRNLQRHRLHVSLKARQAAIAAMERRARPPHHHQPAHHGGKRHAQRVCRPDRVDGPPPEPARAHRAVGAPTTTGAPAWPPPSWR